LLLRNLRENNLLSLPQAAQLYKKNKLDRLFFLNQLCLSNNEQTKLENGDCALQLAKEVAANGLLPLVDSLVFFWKARPDIIHAIRLV